MWWNRGTTNTKEEKVMKKYINSEIEYLIDEHIHSKRDRLILKLKFIDGYSNEYIAALEEVNLSPRRVSTIISNGSLIISEYLK